MLTGTGDDVTVRPNMATRRILTVATWLLTIAFCGCTPMREPAQWASAQRHHMVQAYNLYLFWYPHGDHAAIAQERIQEIQSKAARVKAAVHDGLRLSRSDEIYLESVVMRHFHLEWNYAPKWNFASKTPGHEGIPVRVALRNMANYPPYQVAVWDVESREKTMFGGFRTFATCRGGSLR